MEFELRPYQKKAIFQIEEAWSNGHRSVCHQSPTGSGKSVIFRSIIDNHSKSKNHMRHGSIS